MITFYNRIESVFTYVCMYSRERLLLLLIALLSYLGPPCSTIVTGPTRWVTPPTLTAAVSSSLIWTSACFRVLPRLQRVCAADRKLLLDTYRNHRYKRSHCQTRIYQLILIQLWQRKKKWVMSKLFTAWSGVVPIKAKSCPSSTLYVGLSRLSSMARDCSRVKELLRWLVGWCRLLKITSKGIN